MPVSVCESSMSLALRDCLSSSSTKSDDMQLKNQLVSSAKRVLLSKIDYEEVNNYTTTVLDSLKTKYIVLKATNFTKSTLYDEKDKNLSRMNGNGTNHGTKDEQLGNPKRILFPRDNIQIGWSSSSRKWHIGSGMVNVGNTCYLNSILQALFHVPALANWLFSDSQHREICEDLGGGQGGCIICAMSKTLISSQNSQMPIKPLLVYSKLRLVCKHLVPGRQEDAHEFLRYLVEAMEKAYLHRFKNSKDLDQYSKETTPLNQILGGYLRSTVRCLACGHVSTTFQHFEDLLLDIRKANSIEEALDGYFARERLEDMGYKCESCKKKVSATKQFSLERAPIVLCMQLKRFSMMGNKINKHVVIRPKLDLSPHASTKKFEKLTYKLVAMVTHLGPSQNCGHYTAIGLTEVGDYYHFDDSCVRPISIQNALNTNAYILFYELDNVKTNHQIKTIVNDSACKLIKKNSEENLSWKTTTTATEVKSKDEDAGDISWIFGNNKNHVSKSVFDNLSNSVDEKSRNTSTKSNQDIIGTPSLSSPSTSSQPEVKLNAVRETMTQMPANASLLPKENGSKALPISEIKTIYSKSNEDNTKSSNTKSPIVTSNTTSKLVINENGYKVLSTLSPKVRENFFEIKKTTDNNLSNENSHNKNILFIHKKKDYTLTPQIKSPIKLPSLPILTSEEKSKTEYNCNNKSNGQIYSLANSHTNGKHNNFINHNGNDNNKIVNNNKQNINHNNNEAKVIIPRSLVPYETDDESDNYNDDDSNIINNKTKNNNNNNNRSSMDVDEAPVVKTKAGFWQVTEIPVQNPSLQGKTSNMKCTEIIATKQKKHKIENDTINHLLKYSHRGYGAPVVSWNDKKTNLEKEVNEEKRSEKTRDQEDQDDDSEFDRGRTKKIKLQNGNNTARDNPGFNPFQEAQNQQNRRWNNNSSSSSSNSNNGGRFYNNHIYRQNPHHHNYHSNRNNNNFRSRFKNGYNSFHHQRNDSSYRRRD